MVTLPLLNFVGLPIDVANATNRIAILLQNVVATYRFWRKGKLDLRRVFPIVMASSIGAVVGAMIVLSVDRVLLKRIIGLIFLLLLVVMMKRPEISGMKTGGRRLHPVLSFLMFFLIGVYGGFIQAGVGFLFVYALVLGEGMDIVRANGVKVFAILIYTTIALAVFSAHGLLSPVPGLVLAAGNMLGAYIGTSFATRTDTRVVKWVFAVMVIAVSLAYLLGV